MRLTYSSNTLLINKNRLCLQRRFSFTQSAVDFLIVFDSPKHRQKRPHFKQKGESSDSPLRSWNIISTPEKASSAHFALPDGIGLRTGRCASSSSG